MKKQEEKEKRENGFLVGKLAAVHWQLFLF
jgi:hypothetical protein